MGLVAAVCCTTSVFAQGIFQFKNSSTTAVFDNFTTPGTPIKGGVGGNLAVALLYASSANAVPAWGTAASGTGTPISWVEILNGGSFKFATNGGAFLLSAVGSSGPTAGTFNGGNPGLDGTNPGDTVTMVLIAYSSSFANPFLASQAGAPLGWSNAFNMLLGSTSAPGSNLNGTGMLAFNVNAVPEPATFALAGPVPLRC